MEKGFREIECEGCHVILKFHITEKNYGRTGTVECKICGQKHNVKIPFPPSENRKDIVEEMSDFVKNTFDDFFKG